MRRCIDTVRSVYILFHGKVQMEVKASDLRKMSRKERNRTIAALARAATAHHQDRSVFASVLNVIRTLLRRGVRR